MSTVANKDGKPAGAERTAPLLRSSLQALIRDRRAAKLREGMKGNEDSTRQRFRGQYQESLLQALEGHPRLTLDVMPDALWYSDQQVLEATERKGDVVEVLFTEGVRSITIEHGVTPLELDQLGEILTTTWGERAYNESDLASTIWEADMSHIHFELVERLTDEQVDGESPSVARIEAMLEQLEAEAASAAESGMLRQDEAEVLLRIRDAVGEKQEAAELRVDRELSPRLVEELRLLQGGHDLDHADLGSLLALSLHAVENPASGEVLGQALVDFVLRQAGAGQRSSAGIHRMLELQDPESTPHMKWRSAVGVGLAQLKEPDALAQLVGALPLHEDPSWNGFLFSLGGAIRDEEVLRGVAAAIPGWAARPLGDAMLLREQAEVSAESQDELFTHVKGRLMSGHVGGVRLGLAMAARMEDARLGEPLLGLSASPDGNIREGALFALRKHPSPRLRTRVQELFADPFEPVRIEVLRHAVASRDLQIARKIEARLMSEELRHSSEHEVRALCMAMGRLLKGEADSVLLALALGQKHSFHPAVHKMALYGLKASNTRNARVALQRVITEQPRLATDAEAILREMGA